MLGNCLAKKRLLFASKISSLVFKCLFLAIKTYIDTPIILLLITVFYTQVQEIQAFISFL
jgi:hypothetical protein